MWACSNVCSLAKIASLIIFDNSLIYWLKWCYLCISCCKIKCAEASFYLAGKFLTVFVASLQVTVLWQQVFEYQLTKRLSAIKCNNKLKNRPTFQPFLNLLIFRAKRFFIKDWDQVLQCNLVVEQEIVFTSCRICQNRVRRCVACDRVQLEESKRLGKRLSRPLRSAFQISSISKLGCTTLIMGISLSWIQGMSSFFKLDDVIIV